MLISQVSPRCGLRCGTVAVFVAVCLTVLIAVVAIALDGGILLTERRHAQATADATALSAAADLLLGKSFATAQGNALLVASANGYCNDGVTSIITPNSLDAAGNPMHGIWNPPISGDHVGDADFVEVVVQWNQSRSFSMIFGSGTIPVSARAVAGLKKQAYSSAGLLVLDPSAQGALTLSGSGQINVNAPVIVDSSSSKATVGSSTIQVTAPQINITGDYRLSGTASLNGQVSTGVAPTADPLTGIPVPDPLSLPLQSSSQVKLSGGSEVLSPGVYQGGISLSNAAVTLMPGIYYLDGGGLTASGSSSIVGNGVMIYSAPSSTSQGIILSSSGTLTLSPPTSGTYQGLTIFQDRNSAAKMDLSGSSLTSITGTLYLAGAPVTISGSSGIAQVGSQYISRTLSLSGSSTIDATYSGANVVQKKWAALVE